MTTDNLIQPSPMSQKFGMHQKNQPFATDIESIHNVFSFVNYYPNENRFAIHYHGDPSLLNLNKILNRSATLFDPIVKTRFDNVKPTIMFYPITPESIKSIFETPDALVVGFNSIAYDAPLLAFIIDYVNRYGYLPTTEVIRQVSDLLINAVKAYTAWPSLELMATNAKIYFKRASKRRGMRPIDIDSIIQGRKLSWNESSWVNLLDSWIKSNYHADVMLLNPVKSDSAKTERIGLKRVAAQYGLQVVEPKVKIDLSDSLADINSEQLCELLPYNASDTFVTYHIFSHPLFQDQLNLRKNMMSKYGDRFRGRVNINSTNAQLVKFYTAPDESLPDNHTIDTFFPIHGSEHEEIVNQINATYVKGTTTYAQMIELDQQWTNWLQSQPGYEPATVMMPWSNQPQTFPRYRIKYGELQQDLLEYMRESHPSFPIEAYHYYGLFRYATDRKVLVENFVESYPEPPLGFGYDYKKDPETGAKIPRIFYEYIIPGSDMRITCSIGGVHGDVMMADQYTQIASYINRRNSIATYLQTQFATANDVKDWVDENGDAMHHPDLGKFTPSDFITKSGKTRNFKKIAKPPARKDFVKIVDLLKILHADVTSLYPSIIILLRFLATWNHTTNDWDDPYALQRDIRVAAKAIAQAVPKADWTATEYDAEDSQLLAKLFLNNASGEMDSSYTSPIRMNRNAATMRLVGQLILLDIVHTVAELGGESVSTNTDGVYLVGISLKELTVIVNNWQEHYGLEAEPEVVDRFISKDANNRYEVLKGGKTRNASGAMLSNFDGMTFVKKWTQPPIVDEALIDYFDSHTDVSNTPNDQIDKDSIYAFIERRVKTLFDENTTFEDKLDLIIRLCMPIQLAANTVAFKYLGADKNNQLILEPLDKVSRQIFTKHGYPILSVNVSPVKPVSESTKTVIPTQLETTLLDAAIKFGKTPQTPVHQAKIAKITNYDLQNCTTVNEDLTTLVDHPIWQDIDIDAYVKFTCKQLDSWNNYSEKRVKARKPSILAEIKASEENDTVIND